MGLPEDNYSKLGSYCHNLEKTNLGSVFFIQTDVDNRFKYFFMVLGPCIRGLMSSIRQLESFPCAHAIAVALHRGISAHVLCSQYYTIDYWRAAYAETIFSVPNEVEWEVPDHIAISLNILPPLVKRRAGRKSTSRIPSAGECLRCRRCGRCGATGHTQLNCSSQVPLTSSRMDRE
ncbi:CCHC-type domain-containing protein [Abeliophyllum distichum]|uniref:CCHC-type domain-containing protein n=1 Tax=Abeliophyllum distichum TaxID=126358 RepID=A0ABD1Q710_9LAMI